MKGWIFPLYSESELEPLVNLTAALFRLENSRSPEDIRRVLVTLIEWLNDPKQTGLRRAFTVWIKRVILPARLPEAEIPEINDLQEVKAMLAERVVEWTKEWKEEGVKEGRKKGETEVLLRLLKRKFGRLPEKYQLIVQSTNTDLILEYAERVLTAASINEVFEKK